VPRESGAVNGICRNPGCKRCELVAVSDRNTTVPAPASAAMAASSTCCFRVDEVPGDAGSERRRTRARSVAERRSSAPRRVRRQHEGSAHEGSTSGMSSPSSCDAGSIGSRGTCVRPSKARGRADRSSPCGTSSDVHQHHGERGSRCECSNALTSTRSASRSTARLEPHGPGPHEAGVVAQRCARARRDCPKCSSSAEPEVHPGTRVRVRQRRVDPFRHRERAAAVARRPGARCESQRSPSSTARCPPSFS
jgi:hypothetical protein